MNEGDESGASAEPNERRSGFERVRDWLLLDGNRLVVAGLVLAGVLAALVAIEAAGLVPLRSVQPVYYVFSALVGGNITLITVVVSLNQLLLSQEFQTPGQLRSQIADIAEYRREVEEAAGEVAPVKPMGFLKLLLENTRREAQRLGGLSFGAVDDEVGDRIDDLVEALTAQMDAVDRLLDEPDASTFEVLSVTLTTNYAEQIREIRRIRRTYGEELPDGVAGALDGLVDRLRHVDIARQYFKSVYLQQELSSLSRVLLYAGIPAELVGVVFLLWLTAGSGPEMLRTVRLLLPAAITVGFLPLALLVSFILRTATVTQRTAATLPFTTPEQER